MRNSSVFSTSPSLVDLLHFPINQATQRERAEVAEAGMVKVREQEGN